MSRAVKIAQDPENIVTLEVLAEEIVNISEGVKRLRDGRLKEDTLILLIQHAAPNVGARCNKKPVTARTVKAVLDGIESLKQAHVKPT